MNSQRRELLLAEFKRWGYDERGWLPGTRERYARDIRGADRWLGEHRGTPITRAKIEDLKAYLYSKPPNARTRNRTRGSLLAFGAWMVDAGIQDTNHALTLPRLPEPQLLPKPLTKTQMRSVIGAASVSGPMIECLVHIFAYGGLRKSEVRFLEWSNIILDGNEGRFQFVGKRRKERTVPIVHANLVKVLTRWRVACDDARYVFPSSRHEGKPMSETWVRDALYAIGDIVGIDHLNPHRLRHTFATELSDSGAPLEVIQELMGHADPKTTRIYLGVKRPRLREGMRGLDYSAPDLSLVISGGSSARDAAPAELLEREPLDVVGGEVA